MNCASTLSFDCDPIIVDAGVLDKIQTLTLRSRSNILMWDPFICICTIICVAVMI